MTPFDIGDLRAKAMASPTKRSRVCMHKSTADPIQEMIVFALRDNKVRTHRHPGTTQSTHVIEGLMTVLLYNDAGEESGRIQLGGLGSGRSILCRLLPGQWHSEIVESEYAVFHEVIGGPFVPGRNEFAPWDKDFVPYE